MDENQYTNQPFEVEEDPDRDKYEQLVNQLADAEEQQPTSGTQEAPQQAQPEQKDESLMDIGSGILRGDIAQQKINEAEAKEENKGLVGFGEQVRDTAAGIVMGPLDFVFDAVGIIPGLGGVDDWYDANIPRSHHTIANITRDIGGIIIPSLLGAGLVTKGAKIVKGGKTLSKLGKLSSLFAAESAVTYMSDTSLRDNAANLVEGFTGEGSIPWAIRPEDGPDTRRMKNVMENAGFFGVAEMVGATIKVLKGGSRASIRAVPKDEVADSILRQGEIDGSGIRMTDDSRGMPDPWYGDEIGNEIESVQLARESAQTDEALKHLANDPDGQIYNAYLNTPAEDQLRAVSGIQDNALGAKIDNALMHKNLGTTNGRARPVASRFFKDEFLQIKYAGERADYLKEISENGVIPQADAIITDAAGRKSVLGAKAIKESLDNLVQKAFSLDTPEFAKTLNELKNNVYQGQKYLDEQSNLIIANAVKKGFDIMFDPDNIRASALLVQDTAGSVADNAKAVSLIGDALDTSTQQIAIHRNMSLMNSELAANRYIAGRALALQKLKTIGDPEAIAKFMTEETESFSSKLKDVKAKASKVTQTFEEISKKNPDYLKPLIEAYDLTNGRVDDLHNLFQWADNKIGFIKKGFIDGNPEMPSQLIEQINAIRYNNMLFGLAPVRAMFGNSILTVMKPVTALVGAKVTGNEQAFKRALYVYGGVQENFMRGLKVMGDEWKKVNMDPDAILSGRKDMASLAAMKMDEKAILDEMAIKWKADGEHGKVALWNITQGLSWYNKQNFVRFGVNSMYALDGFVKSFMSAGTARAQAYDELFKAGRGIVNEDLFKAKSTEIYNKIFKDGVITDEAARHAASEISLNLDNNVVNALEDLMKRVPIMKPLFMFPRTGVNALQLAWSYSPTSSLGTAMGKARKVLKAVTKEEMTEALMEHGIEYSDEAFQALKGEYIGRQVMGGLVVTAAGMFAASGGLTGNGPADAGEKRRMMSIGWKPLSIRNPLNGEWVSYQGFEPFDTFLGLVGDITYQAGRVDEAITEDWFGKLSNSISMNIANKTFLSGFEPLVSMLSGDEGAWNRFLANQVDTTLIPLTGARSILSKMVSPQLRDVKNDMGSYLKNRNRFLYGNDDHDLPNYIDLYTGEPINYLDPMTAAINSVKPFFKTNGGMEPWRKWLIQTGWDKLQTLRTNEQTGKPLEPYQRQWVNNWIAKNVDLKGQIIKMMERPDKAWDKDLKNYRKNLGYQNQSDWNIKNTITHIYLNQIHDDAFSQAWSAFEAENAQMSGIEAYNRLQKQQMGSGNYTGAADSRSRSNEIQDEIDKLVNIPK